MYPIDFVAAMIEEGRNEDVVQMLKDFSDKLHETKTQEHRPAYNFAMKFLISVMGELRHVTDWNSLLDNRILSVWKELGFFGIDWELIQENAAEDE